jgi:hypothetical protein
MYVEHTVYVDIHINSNYTHVDTHTYTVDIPAKNPTEHNAPARTYLALQTVCEDILYEMVVVLRGRVTASCNVCVQIVYGT